jgi:hypothetical protein
MRDTAFRAEPTASPAPPGASESGATLPNLIVIGAMKAGTTSLHHYLGFHPEIQMSEPKELRFFVAGGNWRRGTDWYRSHFDARAPIRGESTPAYTKHPFFPGVPERMHEIVPGAKLVYLVRDPIERAVSQYIHNYARGTDRRPIDEALSDVEGSRYVQCSRYYMQLSQYLEHYPASQILVLAAEDLRNERGPTLTKVFDFLGVGSSFDHPAFDQTRHASSAKRDKTRIGVALSESKLARRVAPRAPSLLVGAVRAYNSRTARKIDRPIPGAETRRMLADYLAEDVALLRKHTGLTFEGWTV